MINNDKAIEYGAELLKTKTMLENISSLGIDVSADIKLVEEIISETKKEASSISSAYSSGAQTFKESSYEIVYNKSISRLKEIQESLKVHDIYFMGKNMAESLRLTLSDPTLNESVVTNMAYAAIEMINRINKSDTRAFEEEQEIVNDLYAITYEILKLELNFKNESIILNECYNNPIMYEYLNNLVKKEINDAKNIPESLNKSVRRANSIDGLNPNYLTKEILIFLNMANKNFNISNIVNILKKMLDYLKNLNTKDYKYRSVLSEISYDANKCKDTLKENRKTIFKRLVYTIILTTILGRSYKTIGAWAEYGGTDRAYMRETSIIYESGENNLIAQEYVSPPVDRYTIHENSTKLYEITPWEEYKTILGDSKFSRVVTTYNLTDLNLSREEINNYFIGDEIDLVKLGIKGESETEKKDSLTLEDLYTEKYRYIKNVFYDKENIISEVDEEQIADETFWVSLIVTIIFCIFIVRNLWQIVNVLIEDNKEKKKLKNLSENADIKEEILKKTKEELERLQNDFMNLYEQYKEEIKDAEVIQYGKILKRERNK